MIRKLCGASLAVAGVVALATGVLGGERVRLYGKTGERWIGEQVEKIEGVTMKLELLKTKVHDLDGEVSRLERGVVQRQVEVDTLASRLKDEEANVARRKKTLERAASMLEENKAFYEINGHAYTREDLEHDARGRLEQCRDAEKGLDEDRRVLTIREKTLEIARQHLERARTRRVDLSREVRSLEARIAQHKAKRALAEALESPDLSRELCTELGKVEKMTKELEDKLAVEERIVDERLAKTEARTSSIDLEQTEAPAQVETARAIREFLTAPAPKAAPATPQAPAVEAPAPAIEAPAPEPKRVLKLELH
jgi:hypothetical protein